MKKHQEIIDFPFDEVVAKANQWIARDCVVYFKFTCAHCGSRQTFDVPNTIYAEGSCEECGGITNLREAGCNFLLVADSKKYASVAPKGAGSSTDRATDF